MMDTQSKVLLELIEPQKDEQTYLRLRAVILWLSESCARAVELRSDLAPVLAAALQYAVGKLLMDGDAQDLIALEAWLAEDSGARSATFHQSHYPTHGATAMARMAA